MILKTNDKRITVAVTIYDNHRLADCRSTTDEIVSKSYIALIDLILMIIGIQRHFQQYFSYPPPLPGTSWRTVLVVEEAGVPGRREPLTTCKQLVKFITCGYQLSAPFL